MMSKFATFEFQRQPDVPTQVVKFHSRDGLHLCDVEGRPALSICHPSYERVETAFRAWHSLLQELGCEVSDIEWKESM